jgi:hypothetical protein
MRKPHAQNSPYMVVNDERSTLGVDTRTTDGRTVMRLLGNKTSRRLLAMSAPAAAIIALSASPASAAPSHWAGCTPSTPNPSGMVCLTTGASTRVSRTSYAFWNNICNYKASLTFYYPGNGYDRLWKYGKAKSCSTGGAWFDFYTNWNVPSGTYMCGSFYQGDNLDGTACRRV